MKTKQTKAETIRYTVDPRKVRKQADKLFADAMRIWKIMKAKA